MTGLLHPSDLREWRAWHQSRHPIRLAAHGLSLQRASHPAQVELLAPTQAKVLVCVEAPHASVQNAVASVLDHLPVKHTAILCPEGWVPPDSYVAHSRSLLAPQEVAGHLHELHAVLAAGHYTSVGSTGLTVAVQRDAEFFISQHGALTPYAPPLPAEARLLAWSESDAEFWKSGRSDISHDVVGSQLLWNASLRAQEERPASSLEDPVGPFTYLGQMHAAELSRGKLARAAAAFCRANGVVYRPHPSERDKLSRLTHAAYSRIGITVDASRPLNQISGPVVSVFSTGVLEAAAQGRNAWVDFPKPPDWLQEYWTRYGMHRYGDSPTPAQARPSVEPAWRIAEILRAAVA